MGDFRYKLDKSSRKFICPGCQKKRLTLFIDTTTGHAMPEHYGRCDREANCGYFNAPGNNAPRITNAAEIQPRKDVFIPEAVLQQTLSRYQINGFINNLLKITRANEVERIISLYYLGTTKAGAVTIPFIDKNGNIRAIQVKSFDSENHTTNTTFLHAIIEQYHRKHGEQSPEWLKDYLLNESKVSCLFGEHLLTRYPNNPIALIEAPKGAIYGSLYFGSPEDPSNFLWLAVYNLSSLTLKKCMALKGREVVLFPDLSKTGHAFELWSKRADEFNTMIPGATFRISDLLEKHATPEQRQKGFDLADYLIQFDWHTFQSMPQPKEAIKQPENDIDFLIESQRDYTEQELIKMINQIQPRGDPKQSLKQLIEKKYLKFDRINKGYYYTPF